MNVWYEISLYFLRWSLKVHSSSNPHVDILNYYD